MTQNPFEDRGATAFGTTTGPGEPVESGPEAVQPPRHGNDVGDHPSTTDQAKGEAGAVKDTAVDAGKNVAETAKSQATNVVEESKAQAKGLLDQVKSQANDQVGTQQQRLAGILGTYSTELDSMATNTEQSGPLTDLVRQGADKSQEFSRWLEHHEPSDLLQEVQSFARRRPAAFLIGAAIAGIAVGRLSRGFAAEVKDDKESTESAPSAVSNRADNAPRSMVQQVPTQAEGYRTQTDPYIENTVPYGSVGSTGDLRTEDTAR